MNLANVCCEKCGIKNQPGVLIGKMSGLWLCGVCIAKAQSKIAERNKQLILEEDG